MADKRSELRILHSRSSLGRYLSDDRITDDAQNLRLCMDRSYRLQFNEKSTCKKLNYRPNKQPLHGALHQ